MKELGIAIKEPIIQVKETMGTEGAYIVANLVNGMQRTSTQFSITNQLASIKNALLQPFSLIGTDANNIGANLAQGIANGMESQRDLFSGVSIGLTGVILSSLRKAGDIHSPSGKTAELVGKPLAQGIGVGFVDEMGSVADKMANEVPVDFNTNTKVNSTFNNASIAQDSNINEKYSSRNVRKS